jgi:hypothetical protein
MLPPTGTNPPFYPVTHRPGLLPGLTDGTQRIGETDHPQAGDGFLEVHLGVILAIMTYSLPMNTCLSILLTF